MARPVFNKAGTFSFTATAGHDAEPIAPYSLVSARLYLDAPNDTQIADSSYTGGDAIENVTSWLVGENPHERLISYSAITDPDPTSDDDYELRFWAVSFRFANGGTIVNQVKPFIVWRPRLVSSRFDCIPEDLYAVEGKIENLLGNTIAGIKIALAERLVNQDLRGKGIKIPDMEQSDAKDLLRYRALQLCCMDLSNQPNDEWWAKAEAYEKLYMTIRDSIPIGLDSDDDGDIEPGEAVRLNEARGFFIR